MTIQLLRFVAERVRPPRALSVPFPHGRPLDAPGDPDKQHAVLQAALRLLEDREARPPLLADLAAGRNEGPVAPGGLNR